MTHYAPESPTTAELQQSHIIETTTELDIALTRVRVGDILTQRAAGLVAIIGPCALTGDRATIASEGDRLADLTRETEGFFALHRMPPWKPRTNPEDWHGEETTNPEGAYSTIHHQAHKGAGVSIELGHLPHADRYAPLTVFDWFGGRNIGMANLMDRVAIQHPDLPLGVKNGLDGNISQALSHIERLKRLREPDGAPVLLIYRGGENATDPQSWENQYRQALGITGGSMVIDVAHGSEMAHDPNRNFKKSVEGQAAALRHVLALAEEERLFPSGIMLEASDADSPTDPHLPFQTAVEGVVTLHALRLHTLNDAARI